MSKMSKEFLGFCNFYWRFVPGYSKIEKPLFDLLHKDKSWEWLDKVQEAFDGLKNTLKSTPVLMQPNTKEEFFLECDTSNYATGAILSQRGMDRKLHPVTFDSKCSSPAEKNYDIFDKEMLVVISAFKEW
jgi:hypothetical protein